MKVVFMRVVLVTGCNGLVGRLAAIEFARHGDVVIAGMTSMSTAFDLERTAASEGAHLDAVRLDLRDAGSIRDVLDRLVEEHQQLDVCVNAGEVAMSGPAHLSTADDVRWQFDADVFGVLEMARQVVPIMRQQGSGIIVNLTSVAGIVTVPYWGIVSAARHAIEAISEAMYFELMPHGIRVALVDPGGYEIGLVDESRRVTNEHDGTVDHDLTQRFNEALMEEAAITEKTDARLLARAIHAAAGTAPGGFRVRVGARSRIGSPLHEAYDFEAYERSLRETLNWWP
jgi:NAD(P)-dependent dehydrogenase (short-subunit alcohol dehydrogenase family)